MVSKWLEPLLLESPALYVALSDYSDKSSSRTISALEKTETFFLTQQWAEWMMSKKKTPSMCTRIVGQYPSTSSQQTAEIPSNSITAEEKSRFTDPMSEEDVAKAWRASVPKKIRADTKYCMHLWYDWSAHRSSRVNSDLESVPDIITQIDCEAMQYILVESLCVN